MLQLTFNPELTRYVNRRSNNPALASTSLVKLIVSHILLGGGSHETLLDQYFKNYVT